jgi:hypothetical protein
VACKQEAAVEKTLRALSFVILALMLSAVVYASVISVVHWTGIGV